MKHYKLKLAYDGTAYHGWQIQPNRITIQEKLEEAIQILTRHPTKVIGAGRTDAGVHALGQVAYFQTPTPLNERQFFVSLNGLLTKDIRVLKCEEVDDTFHARYSAKEKCYRYCITTDRVQLPFNRLYSWHHRVPLDLSLMKTCAASFVGTHDFSSFANETRDLSKRSPIRTVHSIDLIEVPEGITLEFRGASFLYKMVRNLTGALVEVGKKKITIDAIKDILHAKDRTLAPAGAPAHGLFLVDVSYE